MNVKNETTTVNGSSYNNESISTLIPFIKHPCINSTKHCQQCLNTYNDSLWVQYYYICWIISLKSLELYWWS